MNTTTAAPEFTIVRTATASRDEVWRAWIEERELAGWLPSTPLESIDFDVRDGGRYRYTMVNSETGEEFPTGGVFLEVVPRQKLVFTWGNPGDPVESSPVATVTLASAGDATEVVFHLRGFAGHPGDGYVHDGWAETLDALVAHVAGRGR